MKDRITPSLDAIDESEWEGPFSGPLLEEEFFNELLPDGALMLLCPGTDPKAYRKLYRLEPWTGAGGRRSGKFRLLSMYARHYASKGDWESNHSWDFQTPKTLFWLPKTRSSEQNKPTSIDVEESWRIWAHRVDGECPCGVRREMCTYHST